MNLPPQEERALIDSFEVSMLMMERAREMAAMLNLVGHRPSEEAVGRIMQALASNFASLLADRADRADRRPVERARKPSHDDGRAAASSRERD